MNKSPVNQLQDALAADDHARIAELLDQHAEIIDNLKDPGPQWQGPPPLATARSVEAAKKLLAAGASLEPVSRWWEPGFGVFHTVVPEVGAYFVEQGARVSPHAAAAMGLTEVVRNQVQEDPSIVHSKGGDEATPLHFARSVEVADLFLDAGADPDARDGDHDSTPVQWLMKEAPDVVRHLIERGAMADIFAAAALGDQALCDRLIDEHEPCLSYWVGAHVENAPPAYRNLGGTMYQWSLGFNSFAHQYAKKRGHDELCDYLLSRSDLRTQFLVNCLLARREEAMRIIGEHPTMVSDLPPLESELLARYCWETNADLEAVRVLVDVGFPLDHPETRHSYMPLHNAAWGGYADIVDFLIERGAPINAADPHYQSTPLGHAIHCCCYDGRHPEGEYTRVVTALLDAGATWDPTLYPTRHEKIDPVLESRLRDTIDGAARLGEMDLFEEFLAKEPTREQLDASLQSAARGGHFEICRKLLDLGAKNGPPGDRGPTPLHKAVLAGSYDVASLLVERGADPTVGNVIGATPLHTAGAAGADKKMVDLLIGAGADAVVELKNDFGATAVDWALERGHEATADAIRAHIQS